MGVLLYGMLAVMRRLHVRYRAGEDINLSATIGRYGSVTGRYLLCSTFLSMFLLKVTRFKAAKRATKRLNPKVVEQLSPCSWTLADLMPRTEGACIV
jgi:hypothetical protein